jgi:hypothetical protein
MWNTKQARPFIRGKGQGIAGILLSGILSFASNAMAQNTPLLSGGVGFITTTNGGNTTYTPVVSPLVAIPLGQRFLVESRASILESISPKGGGQPGYKGTAFQGLSYLQLDYLTGSHLTVVAGEFLTPFGTYNERLTPNWIGNFASAPVTFGLGTMGTGSSVGGMLRGSAVSTPAYSVDYAAYFSARSGNQQFDSERSAGGRLATYLPRQRLELGASYGRALQGVHSNYSGMHVWWEPESIPFKLRSEYAHGPHSQGYWIEADYRLSRFGGYESPIGRLEPVFRFQQAFRNSPDPTDGLPAANTVLDEFGLDYHLPRYVRINASYSRQLSSTGNRNVWWTGVVYRFLFPAWRGK